jgi:hypothetical protein
MSLHDVVLVFSTFTCFQHVTSHVTICGDIHCQFHDLAELFQVVGLAVPPFLLLYFFICSHADGC